MLKVDDGCVRGLGQRYKPQAQPLEYKKRRKEELIGLQTIRLFCSRKDIEYSRKPNHFNLSVLHSLLLCCRHVAPASALHLPGLATRNSSHRIRYNELAALDASRVCSNNVYVSILLLRCTPFDKQSHSYRVWFPQGFSQGGDSKSQMLSGTTQSKW